MSELTDCINNLSAKDIIRSVAKTANGVPFYLQTVGGGFCSEYQRIYDDLAGSGTPPGDAVAAAQNTMVCTLVDAGIWAKLDTFYCYAQTVNTAGEALVNWVNPGTYDATAFNAPIFTSLEGFTGGGTAYIDTNWNPAVNGVNYIQDNASVGCYIRTNVDELKTDFGVSAGGAQTTQLWSRRTNSANFNLNSTLNNNNVNADSRGFFVMIRDAANNMDLYKNKNLIVDGNRASIAIPNGNMFVLARNLIGTGPGLKTTRQLSFFLAGAALSPTEINILTDTIEAYMDSNGKGVIP